MADNAEHVAACRRIDSKPLMRDGGSDFEYDLAIVGSGGGAFAAAIAARRMDLRVVMFERARSVGRA